MIKNGTASVNHSFKRGLRFISPRQRLVMKGEGRGNRDFTSALRINKVIFWDTKLTIQFKVSVILNISLSFKI
jgi:hypothetical protein